MTPSQVQALVRGIAPVVAEQVAAATGPLIAEIADLRRQLSVMPVPKDGQDGAPGRDGVDGKDGERGQDGAPGCDGVDGKDGLDGAPGEPGRDGVDGKDGAPGLDGKDGIDGQDGAPGEPGAAGRDGVDGQDGQPGADGKDGVDGASGLDGKDGAPGQDGRDGIDGKDGSSVVLADVQTSIDDAVRQAVDALPKAKDGVGVAGAVIDRDGALILTLSDGTQKALGPVVGRDGIDGQNGKDGERGEAGFSLDDFDVGMGADGRTLELKFVRGDVREVYELAFPVMVYRGVYKEELSYERGDTVTWAGALWHCNAQTGEKPGEGVKDWTLAVRRGRDGKDAVVRELAAPKPVSVPGAKA